MYFFLYWIVQYLISHKFKLHCCCDLSPSYFFIFQLFLQKALTKLCDYAFNVLVVIFEIHWWCNGYLESSPCNFSPWYSWIIAHLALNNNHSRRVPLAELELLIHPLHRFFLWDLGCSIFSFLCSVLQIMFVLFSFLFWLSQIYWPLYCLSVTDLQLQITLLISSTFLMFHRLYYAMKKNSFKFI